MFVSVCSRHRICVGLNFVLEQCLVIITSFCEKVSWSGRNWNSFWVRTRMFNPRIAILRQCLPCNPGSNDFQVLESPNLMSNCWLNMNFVLAMAYLAASFKDDTSRLKAASIAFSGFSVGIAGKSSTLLSCCVRQCFLKKNFQQKQYVYTCIYMLAVQPKPCIFIYQW